MLGSVSFFLLYLEQMLRRRGPRGKKRPSSDRTKERKNDLHDGIKGKKKTDFSFVLFFFLLNRFVFFIYMLVPENTDIYGKWFFT